LVARFLQVAPNLHAVVLGLFGLGCNPKPRALRAAYAWMFDDLEQESSQALGAFDANGRVFRRLVRERFRLIRSSFPVLAAHMEGVISEVASEPENDPTTSKPRRSSVFDVRERVFVSQYEHWLDSDASDPDLQARAMNPSAEPLERPYPDLPDVAKTRLSLDDEGSYERLVRIRDWMQFSLLVGDEARHPGLSDIASDPLLGSQSLAFYLPFGLAAFEASDELHSMFDGPIPLVIPPADDAVKLAPGFPFRYWALPSGGGWREGSVVACDMCDQETGRRGSCLILLVAPCERGHPAVLEYGERLTLEERARDAGDVWSTYILSAEKLRRLALSDLRSQELSRSLVSGLADHDIHVAQSMGLFVPDDSFPSSERWSSADRLRTLRAFWHAYSEA
jgi:hypothetical protein